MKLPTIDLVHDALIVVDLQPDFMPGGRLAVAGGNEIVGPIFNLMREFGVVVATQDWHPKNHMSFAMNYPELKEFDLIDTYWSRELQGYAKQRLWPVHCVQGTEGASLPPGLMNRADVIIRKGSNPKIDSYSAFRENYGPDGHRNATGLTGWLYDRMVKRVFVCGLARDYCVKETAIDAAYNQAFECFFLWDLTRAVNPADDDKTRADLEANWVKIL